MNRVKIDRPRKKVARAPRTYNRTTIVTTDRKSFEKVRNLKEGESLTINAPNDIISSARNGRDNNHHSIRRVSLLRRQMRGGYSRVKVRWQQGNEIGCVMDGVIVGEEDSPVFNVTIKR